MAHLKPLYLQFVKYWLPTVLLFLCCQLYFINADPHPRVSTSRGPFTDEGLNTHQARNFVNHGYWGVAEGDNLIKSPLFNGYMATTLSIFGSGRTAARASVLFMAIALIFWFGYLQKDFAISALFLLFAGFNFYLFQFFHFSMVEVLVIGSTLITIALGYRYLNEAQPTLKFLLASFIISWITFLLKIQYAYLMLLPYGIWLLALLKVRNKRLFKHLLFLIAATIVSLLLFYFLWYVPLQNVFNTVWAHQGTNRFADISIWARVISDSGQYLIWNDLNLSFAISFLVSIPIGIYLMFTARSPLKLVLAISGLWIILESHKLIIMYLPTRYTLSLFAAMALWMSTCIIFLLRLAFSHHNLRWKKYLAWAMLIPLVASHFSVIKLLFEERTTSSQEVINRYDHIDFKGQTVAGVWATSLIWNKTAHVIPVWKNFLNDQNLIESQKPQLIVTEKNEADSERVFASRDINLAEVADSAATFRYGNYEVYFYFLTP